MSFRPKIVARVVMIAVILGFFTADFVLIKINQVWPLLIVLVLALIILAITLREKLITLAVVAGVTFLSALVFGNFQNQKMIPPADFTNHSQITGMVAERPQLDDKQKVVLQVEHYKILINLPRYPEYSYGQTLKISGKLETPTVFPDFNYQNYLKGKQIYLVVNRADSVEITGNGGSSIKSWLYQTANKFEAALNKSLPEPESSFAAGLLIGSKRGLSDTLITQMQNSGTSHLVAISGYNITIIIIALMSVLAFLGRKTAFSLSLLVTITFVVLTGASASVVRGAIVGLLAIFAKLIDRRANNTNLLLLAAVLILIFNPLMLLYDFGFLLSFSAFAGLIYFSPILSYLFNKDKWLKKLPEFASNPLRETLSAQAMSLPLLLLAFGKFSVIAPLANVLILPLIPTAMAFSLGIGLLGMIQNFAGVLAGYIGWLLLKYPLLVIQYCGDFKLAAFDFGKNWYWLMIGLYLVIAVILFTNRKLIRSHGQKTI